jgi:hypothetical protein
MNDCGNIPFDWQNPNWQEEERVHNWRNYATDILIANWGRFPDDAKQMISEALNNAADREEWE